MARPPVEIQIVRLPHAPADLPDYHSGGAVGMDLRLAGPDVTIEPGDRALLPTGFAIAVPDGFEAQVRMRSGTAMRSGLFLPNAPGTIDPDYRGELRVLVMNGGREKVTVHSGDRVAQLVISPVIRCQWKLVESLPDSGRSAGGFGSTGRI